MHQRPARLLSRPALGAAAAALALLALAAIAHARPADQITANAKRQYAAQEYERVIEILTPVVADPAAAAAQKIDAYELIGLSQLILGDAARARAAFEKLLALDPRHQLRDPSGSPKLRSFFEGVKEAFAPPPRAVRAQLDEAPPGTATAGRFAEFSVRLLSGQQDVRWVMLHWRRAGETSYAAVPYVAGGGDGSERVARVELPVASAPYTVEYYVEALAPGGGVAGRVGGPEQPLTLAVKTPPGRRGKATPIYKRWWFWTLVGAAVAGGATAVIFAAREEAPAGNLPPQVLQLPLSRF